jgi:NAD(P)-dependent dehydrogenase (short-subunit alcohol dehydrogenase family)
MSNEATQRVVVVTGASSGIGLAAAKALLRQGWHVIAHGRDPGRTAAAEAELRTAAAQAGGRVDMVRADLSLLSGTARLADEIVGLTNRVHVLLNNAGGMRAGLAVTAEGNEETIAGNHLGHFLLTNRLLPLLRRAAHSSAPGTVRIVNTSSRAYLGAPPINWSNLQPTDDWQSARIYSLAKLYNILFTRELAKRLEADKIVANALHPGIVNTNFVNHCEARIKAHISSANPTSPQEGADTLIWLATAPEAGNLTGLYFHQREPVALTGQANDDTAARRLWEESEKLTTG